MAISFVNCTDFGIKIFGLWTFEMRNAGRNDSSVVVTFAKMTMNKHCFLVFSNVKTWQSSDKPRLPSAGLCPHDRKVALI